jgi:hypothetical protein
MESWLWLLPAGALALVLVTGLCRSWWEGSVAE